MRIHLASLPLCLFLLARPTAAASPTKLVYSRAPGAELCPDDAWLRDAIGARLGYAPFTDDASKTVVVKIERAGKKLVATIDLLDARGRSQGSRTVDSQSSDCTELASSIALAVSIAIDPMHATHAPENPPPPPIETTQPKQDPALPAKERPVPAPPPIPPPASREPITMFLAAGPMVATGTAPSVSFGGTAQIGVRLGWFSVAIEGRADAPASASASINAGSASGPSNGARVQSSLLAASLLPCAHFGVAFGCAVGALGALSATAIDVSYSQNLQTLFAAAGIRGGAEWMFTKRLGAQAHLDLLAPITETKLRINGFDAWTTSALSFGGGLSVAGHFPVTTLRGIEQIQIEGLADPSQ